MTESVRKEIFNAVYEAGGQETWSVDAWIATDKILSLPSLDTYALSKETEWVAERECPECQNGFARDVNDELRRCLMCAEHPGLISRRLTRAEVLEAFNHFADPDAKLEYYYSQNGGGIYLLLPSGERVRRA